jgi:hypothetical protein
VNSSRSSSPAGSALAQKRIRKLPGFNACSVGHGGDLKQHYHSPINYEMRPTYGNDWAAGWVMIWAGNCRKKALGIILVARFGGLHLPEVQVHRDWPRELNTCLMEKEADP